LASRELVITRITWSREHEITTWMERSIRTYGLGLLPQCLATYTGGSWGTPRVYLHH